MFTIDDDGWLQPAAHCPSPNCNERPPGAVVDLLIIHNISLPPGDFGGGLVQAFFCNTLDCSRHPALAELRDLRVSSHLLIERAGAVTQFVPLHRRAWHAGVSMFEGRANCNDFSIGIELEGTDTEPYAPVQYTQLAAVTRALQGAFPAIVPARIVGHSTVAPGRKTDPGPAFDWQHFRYLLAQSPHAPE